MAPYFIFRLSVAVTMSTIFGYDIPAGDIHHKYMTSAEQILAATVALCHPSGTIINVIPFLRHIPPWFPGASTQRYAANAREVAMAYKNEPFEWVKSRFVLTHLSSVCSKLKVVLSSQGQLKIVYRRGC